MVSRREEEERAFEYQTRHKITQGLQANIESLLGKLKSGEIELSTLTLTVAELQRTHMRSQLFANERDSKYLKRSLMKTVADSDLDQASKQSLLDALF